MHIFNKKIHWSVAILTILVVLEAIAVALLLTDRIGPAELDRNFDNSRVSGKRGFTYSDTLTCHVTQNTHRNSGLNLPYYEVKTFILQGLETDNPKLIINDKPWSDCSKQYDEEGYLTLQMKTSWGSDVIGLDKTTGTFVRTIQGEQAGQFQYAIAQKGYCE